jgi:hypothetical protein
MHLLPLCLCSVALVLCSCASTTVKSTWKSPQYQGGPISELAVLAIDDRVLLRQGFENRFVSQLRQDGATALTTFDLLSLSEIQRDKPAAAERLRSAGAQAIVILRLMDSTSTYRETRPGSTYYAGTVTGYETAGWYDYYSLAYSDISPTYGNQKLRVLLEASLFDLKTAKRLWSGLTQTVVAENMDRVAEMDPIVAKFVAAMRKDGMVP